MQDLSITYITHACIKIEGEFGCLVTDPWILNEPIYALTTWKFPAAIMPPEEVIKGADYLYISHPHEDHLHIPSINLFPRDIKVFLPEFVDYPCIRAQTMERTFREMGFYNIKKLRPFETFQLGDNTSFTLIPAAKSKYWDWENSGFVLESNGTKILNMNDCPADEELYKKVDAMFGEFDLGFIQYSGVSMFPGCFRMPFEDLKAASANRKHGWLQQRHMIELLRVKRIAPFAGDFAWLNDHMYHCNWSNRATPKLFEDFVKTNYPEKNIDVIVMYPTDIWNLKGGLQHNHPPIDWNNYLSSIDKVKKKFKPKVDKIKDWINQSPKDNLLEKTKNYTAYLNKWITSDFIDFSVNARVLIEGENSNFQFSMRATPDTGFYFDWDYVGPVDQSLYVTEAIWAAVLDAKILITNIQWASQQEQHVEFRKEIGRFWFWLENHVDLNNRNSQALIDRALHPELEQRIRPELSVFTIEDEWDKSWLSE